MKFITVFRSMPSIATRAYAGGTCWGCDAPQASLEAPGNRWAVVEVAVVRKGDYVTSEDGGARGLGYLPSEGWYSFPSSFIVRWRWMDEERWRPGPLHSRFAAEAAAAEAEKAKAKAARRAAMTHGGVDYESLLESMGLGEID